MSDYAEMAVEYGVWRRLRERLFPWAPRPERDGDERTYITTDVVVVADWVDRLRFLVTGRARIQVRTYTDVLVNAADSVSAFHVEGW